MKVNLFDFDLPPDRIAHHPVSPRDAARLLNVGSRLNDCSVKDLPDLLNPGDIMVFNNTKVIPGRLHGKRKDASVEVTLHKPEADGWWVFAKPGRKLQPGDWFAVTDDFGAEVIQKSEDGQVLLRFNKQDETFKQALAEHGEMPLPPYIKRGSKEAEDYQHYQTMYAKEAGAVASPTAGLHFTPELMQMLSDKEIEQAYVTLHVGAGTFLPVKSEDTKDHVMHSERYTIDQETVEKISTARANGGKVVAVGTTSMRVLESVAANDSSLDVSSGETDIFITPGYRFKIVERLLTNFHLPKSTLFMLVSAFSGLERMQQAYQHAINSEYRFYSYGDACLLSREDQL